ncbi:microfibril-associated glycoprotein 4-like [Pseudorasbora parva]|uniref:microfibril-associated glycoprotein 4-like n=1 Tax=Pseudorasbora parva TaxID=51549 RepID=UPI00351F234F
MALKVFLVALLSVVLVSDCTFRPLDCSELYNSGNRVRGIYSIYPAGDDHVLVYCHMISRWEDEDIGGWTVIQRRMDGSVNFYRGWEEYKRGFGNVESEYWLGLENMYQLTHSRNYMLRVDLEDFTGRKGFSQYSNFSVGPETDGYRLQVSGFTDGGAGDALHYQNGMKFSTFDKDQDAWGTGNCAKQHLGAFWYNFCQMNSNPNSVYLWGEVRDEIGSTWGNRIVGLKTIIMKIRRGS